MGVGARVGFGGEVGMPVGVATGVAVWAGEAVAVGVGVSVFDLDAVGVGVYVNVGVWGGVAQNRDAVAAGVAVGTPVIVTV